MWSMDVKDRLKTDVSIDGGGSPQIIKAEQTAGSVPTPFQRGGSGFKENRQKSSLLWLWIGIFLSLTASLIYVACYDMFRTRAEGVMEQNPIEGQDNLNWLYGHNQVLYRDLYNLENNADLSYVDLYYPMSGEMADFEPFYEEGAAGTEETAEAEEAAGDEEWSEQQSILYEDYNNLNALRSYLEDYFSQLESEFTDLNENYDYMIRNTKTGAVITNTAQKEALNTESYYFMVSFLYDENGNVAVGDAVKGSNSDRIRRYANEISRAGGLASDRVAEYLDEQGILNTHTHKNYPKNCVITYGVSNEAWASMQNNVYDVNGRYSSGWWQSYTAFTNAGTAQYFLLFSLGLFLLAMLVPYADRGKPWNSVSVCRAPLEVLIVILFVIGSMKDGVTAMVARTATGKATEYFDLLLGNPDVASTAVYLGNIFLLTLVFGTVWYVGVSFRAVREYGVVGYVKKRSLVYRFFPYVKSKCLSLYDALVHFDVTRNAKKLIVKIVLANAAVLFVISSLWLGGVALTVVYSILLYFVLKKYVSDLQKKYSILLSATNEIAQGNLNVGIVEDLGVFEPFKPQIIRIQRGFRNAVEEEVKSQRMKAELITNVSHDLKTPLTAITTYVGLLKDESITPEQRKEYLDILERKSQRLKVLIEDLFEVSKATSKNVTLNIMDVDIMNLVKQVALEMSDKLSESGLDVRMNMTDTRVILPLDSQKTFRVYENLFGNVAKYALPGTRVYVNGFVIDDMVVITLKNITAEEINVSPEELTDRFVRGDVSRNTEGSGLGLAIAKSFTELQNGHLEIEVDGDLFKVTTVWRLPGWNGEVQRTQ